VVSRPPTPNARDPKARSLPRILVVDDEEAILDAATGPRAVVTVEDHSAHGGLGSAVAEVLASRNGSVAPLRVVGLRTFGESGSPKELYAKYGLDAFGIARAAREFLDSLS